MPLPLRLVAATLVLAPLPCLAQRPTGRDSLRTDTTSDSVTASAASAPLRTESTGHFITHMALGFATSIAAHEAGHVIAAYAVGSHPYFGFDRGRPTIYSGLDVSREPHKQFIFSAAGLTVQTLLDETLLDVPHPRGSHSGALERGLLAGGIATVAFYITLGRNDRVSDITFMSRTSSLSKDQVSLIFGSIALLHAVRIHFKERYARFFTAPGPEGGLRVGVSLEPASLSRTRSRPGA